MKAPINTLMAKDVVQTAAHELQVMTYLDYRDYLLELYKQIKAVKRPYSYLQFAEDLGLGATNAVRLVTAKKRFFSTKTSQTVVKALGLHNNPRKYFLALVQYNNAKGAARKEVFFRKLLTIKQEDILTGKEREQIDYYSDWLHPVVRELLRLENSSSNPESLSALLFPNVPAEKIRRSLGLLQSLGLVDTEKSTGRAAYVQEAPILLPSDATAEHLMIAKYHQSMIDLSKVSIVKVPDECSEFNALTVSLSIKEFSELKERIREFCAEVMTREAKEQRRECVAQLNIQLFSLSKWKTK